MEDWITGTINDFLPFDSVFSDGDWVESKDQNPNGKVRLIQLADIGDGYFRNKSNRFLTKTKSIELKCTYLKKGDILIARMPEPLGRACMFPLEGEEKFATVVDVCIIRNTASNILNKYLLYCINSPQIRSRISALQSGSTRKRISRRNFAKIKFPLPPLPIQKAIVQKLDSLLTNLDQGVASLEKAAAQLKIYRQAVLKKAFEGELTKAWREQQIDLPTAEELLAQIKEERQKHYEQQLQDWEQAVVDWEAEGKIGRKPGKPKKLKDWSLLTEEEHERLHNLPITWVWEKAENVMKLITNGSTPKGRKVSKEKNEVPFLKIHNLSLKGKFLLHYKLHYITKEVSITNLKRSRIYPNDVLLNTVGPPLGKSAIVSEEYEEYNANQNVTIYRTFKSFNPKLLNYYLISSSVASWIRDVATATAGQSYMNLGHCRSLPVPVTSRAEQIQIVQEIESRLSVCDKLAETIATSLKKAKALRQSILEKAFEGRLLTATELAACRAAPDYEPAAVLLERIKKEKAERAALARKEKQAKKAAKSKNGVGQKIKA